MSFITILNQPKLEGFTVAIVMVTRLEKLYSKILVFKTYHNRNSAKKNSEEKLLPFLRKKVFILNYSLCHRHKKKIVWKSQYGGNTGLDYRQSQLTRIKINVFVGLNMTVIFYINKSFR